MNTIHPIIEKADKVVAQTYQRFPLVISKGSGCTLWDDAGRAYTDFVAGIAVCNLGHARPEIAAVLKAQAEQLVHVSNLYYTVPQVELAAELTAHSFADRVFFCNSGAEANEAAIKLARRYFHAQKPADRYRIICMENSFHGRTMATLSATGQKKIQYGYDPVLPGFEFVAFNDISALEARMSSHVCAVMLEPIQGEGGVNPPLPGYLQAVRKLCDEAGALLVFDEIQTGMGRTGKLFAYEHFGITPDIMTLAKGLANGLPIGAMLAKEKIAAAFVPGAHASTFGGTPLITAAAREALRILIEEKLAEHSRGTGAYFLERLTALKARHRCVVDVRGLGLLLAMELDRPAAPLVQQCLERGFLINCVQENVLRFVPPLVVEASHIDALVDCLDGLLEAFDPSDSPSP